MRVCGKPNPLQRGLDTLVLLVVAPLRKSRKFGIPVQSCTAGSNAPAPPLWNPPFHNGAFLVGSEKVIEAARE